jgi:hypothetical protein
MSLNTKAVQRGRKGFRRSMHRNCRSGLVSLAAAAAMAAIHPPRASATFYQWVGGASGTWGVASTNVWSPTGLPSNNDTANVTNTLGASQTITYNYNGTAVTLAGLTLDADGGSGAGVETFNMPGNNLNVNSLTIGFSTNGSGGKAVFNQTGGTNIGTTAVLAVNSADVGTYLISGGTFSAPSALYVGDSGTGVVSASAGSVSCGTLLVANASTATGTYILSGTSSLASSSAEYVGYSGLATFNQSGGANSTSFFDMAEFAGSTATYVLSGGSLSSSQVEYVGYSGVGVFNQSNGSNTTTSGAQVYISFDPGSTGTYVLSAGGSLLASGGEFVGYTNVGTFNQSSGSNTIGTLGELSLGQNGGSTGTYVLSGNGFILSGGNEIVGNSGLGTFNESGGAENEISNMQNLIIGNNAGSTGTYVLSGGGGLVDSSNEGVGNSGLGTFNQSGGSNTVANGFNLSLGNNAGSTGTYLLSGNGSLAVSGGIQIGISGFGAFIQSGGVVTSGGLQLGNPGGTGMYVLTGGSITANMIEDIGYFGVGLFNQSGGANSSGGSLILGAVPGSTGTYLLSAGSLSCNGSEYIGYFSVGLFNQSGGTNTLSSGGDLYLGYDGGTTGTYLLSGGIANVSGSVYVGNFDSVDILTVSGPGVLNVGGTLSVAYAGPGTSINLNGGTINTAALYFDGVPSSFNWTSGTLNLTTSVTFDSAAAVSSTSDAFGSGLAVGANQVFLVTGNETLGGTGAFALTLNSGGVHNVSGTLTISPAGTLTQNAGSTLYAAEIVQADGTFNDAAFENSTVFTYQSGSFNGRLINLGVVNLDGNFTASNGIENDTNLSLTSGQVLTVNGSGLDNLGTFNMGGGTLNGTGAILNDFGGTMIAYGMMNSTLTNDGDLHLGGVLHLNAAGNVNDGVVDGSGTILGNFTNNAIIDVNPSDTVAINTAWTNNGQVNLLGAGAVLSGNAISNTASLSGAGVVDATISNSGTIRADGGTLSLVGTGDSNTGVGEMQVAAGDTLLMVNGLSTNAATIALTGGAFDNDSHLITNSSAGYISGWGTFRSGGLTNNGFLYIGGNFDFYGPVTNGATGSINATGSGLNAFFGPVTNSAGGSFTVQPGASVTFFNSYTGTSPVSNGGTVTFAATSSSGPITGSGQMIVGNGGTSSLQLVPGGGSSSQTALIINNGSTVDITNNTFLVNYGSGADPIATIQQYLASGYSGGAWNGTGIVSSTVAALNSSQRNLIYSIGYADGADGIVTGLSSGEIEILPTLAGDAKLQGSVVFGDFQLLAQYFGKSGGWDEGNFTYGPTVDFGDFQLLAQDFGANSSGLTAGEVASLDSFAAPFGESLVANPDSVGFSLVSVPEPARAGLLALAGLGVLGRRRRKTHSYRSLNH